jgi:hypothetical protein
VVLAIWPESLAVVDIAGIGASRVCRHEMPSVQKAHEIFNDRDVVMLAIAIDGTGERAVKPYLKVFRVKASAAF